jgi:hypothetical protein
MPVENEEMILNTMGALTETKNIPMNTRFKGTFGTYQFTISGLDAFPAGTNVYIKDNLLGTLQNVTFNPNYSFEVTGANASVVNRFECKCRHGRCELWTAVYFDQKTRCCNA